MDSINQFASAHPFWFGSATALGGFVARHSLFTRAAARKLIKAYFGWQRRQLKKGGRTDAEIDALMQDEADGLLALAQEAQDEAKAEKIAPAAPAPPAAPAA